MATLKDRIVALVEVSPGLSDREVTDRIIGESAAQQAANQAARALEREGRLIRERQAHGVVAPKALTTSVCP